MWFFKRKKTDQKPLKTGPPCSYCGSTHTNLTAYHGSEQPDPVRAWRGQRYLTCRCFDCGQDFYAKEPPEGLTEEIMQDDGIIDDEEALRAAEDEIRRQVEEEDDRRCG